MNIPAHLPRASGEGGPPLAERRGSPQQPATTNTTPGARTRRAAAQCGSCPSLARCRVPCSDPPGQALRVPRVAQPKADNPCPPHNLGSKHDRVRGAGCHAGAVPGSCMSLQSYKTNPHTPPPTRKSQIHHCGPPTTLHPSSLRFCVIFAPSAFSPHPSISAQKKRPQPRASHFTQQSSRNDSSYASNGRIP
jgi:hypothetical protein